MDVIAEMPAILLETALEVLTTPPTLEVATEVTILIIDLVALQILEGIQQELGLQIGVLIPILDRQEHEVVEALTQDPQGAQQEVAEQDHRVEVAAEDNF